MKVAALDVPAVKEVARVIVLDVLDALGTAMVNKNNGWSFGRVWI